MSICSWPVARDGEQLHRVVHPPVDWLALIGNAQVRAWTISPKLAVGKGLIVQRRLVRLLAVVGFLATLMPVITIQPTLAAGVVGNGDPLSCDEAAFDAALAGGGLVTFDCGPGAFTINLTTTKVIANNTQIDGAGVITLDMNGNDRHFYVPPVATLNLSNIRLENGSTAGDAGILWNDGTVIVNDVFFGGGIVPGLGGAIRNEGTLTATDIFLSANLADQCGGAVYNGLSAAMTITGDSTFIANLSDFSAGGAICNNGGTLNISGATLFDNNSADDGGAIANLVTGSVTIAGATFDGNTSTGDGGAIWNIDGAVSVQHSSFEMNTASNSGGAIFNSGNPFNTFSIADSDFQSNEAGFQGGAVHNESSGGMSVTNTQFSSNFSVNSGGAINNAVAAFMTVTRSSMYLNTANFRGGGIRNGGNMTVETSTISDNLAASQGGGIVNQDLITINNSTVAFNNSGAAGGGIRNSAAGTLNIGNSIITDNTGGADCSNAGGGTFNSLDHNLDSDSSCPIGMANDISGGDANLQPIADNGGATLNHLPGPGSDAIDAGPATCASPDQRGEMRPRNGVCDIGAVEIVPPPDVCYNLYTGQLRRVTGGACQLPYYLPVIFEEGPHYLCANPYTSILSYSYAPTCQPGNFPAIVMPDAAPLDVCLNFYTGAYRIKQGAQTCSAGEVATTLQ